MNHDYRPSRRALITDAARASLGIAAAPVIAGVIAGVVTPGVASAAEAACYDPASLTLSQRTRRRALGYVDASADPARRCGLCAFFAAGAAGCGTCQILSGGPVSASGLCSSYAAKSGH